MQIGNKSTSGAWSFEERLEGVVITRVLDSAISSDGIVQTPAIFKGKRVVAIGRRAFLGCGALKRVDVSFGVRTIEPWAFLGCALLSQLTLPEGLVCIGAWAFRRCASLTSAVIPKSVKRIDETAFCECPVKLVVHRRSYAEQWAIENGIEYETIEEPKSVFFLQSNGDGDGGCITGIDETAIISPGAIVMPSVINGVRVNCIGKKAFNGVERLTNFVLADSVEEIGEEAFGNCRSLTNIVIPRSVLRIGDRAFQKCSSLTSITLPNSLAYLGDGAFSD